MALLCLARILVALAPFGVWRRSLGWTGWNAPGPHDTARAVRYARHVERAATRLPFAARCLPRAMALSWLLRRARLPHALVIAVRPENMRMQADALHAWVDLAGERILGDLPGPWHEVVRLGHPARDRAGGADMTAEN